MTGIYLSSEIGVSMYVFLSSIPIVNQFLKVAKYQQVTFTNFVPSSKKLNKIGVSQLFQSCQKPNENREVVYNNHFEVTFPVEKS